MISYNITKYIDEAIFQETTLNFGRKGGGLRDLRNMGIAVVVYAEPINNSNYLIFYPLTRRIKNLFLLHFDLILTI